MVLVASPRWEGLGGSQGKKGWEKGEVGSCNLTRPIIGSKPGLPGLKHQEERSRD